MFALRHRLFFWRNLYSWRLNRVFFFLLLTISDYGIVMINVFIPKMSSLMIYRMVINHDYVYCYVYELGLRSWWLGPKCRRKGIRKGKDKSHRMWDSP